METIAKQNRLREYTEASVNVATEKLQPNKLDLASGNEEFTRTAYFVRSLQLPPLIFSLEKFTTRVDA